MYYIRVGAGRRPAVGPRAAHFNVPAFQGTTAPTDAAIPMALTILMALAILMALTILMALAILMARPQEPGINVLPPPDAAIPMALAILMARHPPSRTGAPCRHPGTI